MDFSKYADDVSVLLSNIYVGEIVYYSITKTVTPDVNTGDDVKKYTLFVKKRIDNDVDRIHSDYFADMPFTASIIRYGEKVKFPSMKIIEVKEELEEDRCVYQTIIAESTNYVLERV